jgi:hypothetical protein
MDDNYYKTVKKPQRDELNQSNKFKSVRYIWHSNARMRLKFEEKTSRYSQTSTWTKTKISEYGSQICQDRLRG